MEIKSGFYIGQYIQTGCCSFANGKSGKVLTDKSINSKKSYLSVHFVYVNCQLVITFLDIKDCLHSVCNHIMKYEFLFWWVAVSSVRLRYNLCITFLSINNTDSYRKKVFNCNKHNCRCGLKFSPVATYNFVLISKISRSQLASKLSRGLIVTYSKNW